MLKISNTIRRTPTPDGAVLLDIDQGQMYCVNPVGSQILDLIGTGCDEAQIAERVSTAYGANLDAVRTDVSDFLEGLRRQHILSERERATQEP